MKHLGEAAHLGDVLHSAVRAGDAVAAMASKEMEGDVWRGFRYPASKHRGFPHGHRGVFRSGEVRERRRSGAWC